jgi:hypothetical protein
MTLKVKNKILKFKLAINEAGDLDRMRRIMAAEAGESGEKVLRLMRRAAPKGKVEPGFTGPLTGREIEHGRPSLRLGDGTLEEGWGPPGIQTTDDGAKFIIRSTARHMLILLAGAKRHSIPSQPGYLSFFWFRANAGVETFTGIGDHPGFKPATFVRDARGPMGGDQIVEDATIRGAKKVIAPLRRLR